MKFDVVRAWKDAEYRQSLSAEQQAQLESPIGGMELSDADLEDVQGAHGSKHIRVSNSQATVLSLAAPVSTCLNSAVGAAFECNSNSVSCEVSFSG